MTRTYVVERAWNSDGGSLVIQCAKCGEQFIRQADTAPWTAADIESRTCQCLPAQRARANPDERQREVVTFINVDGVLQIVRAPARGPA